MKSVLILLSYLLLVSCATTRPTPNVYNEPTKSSYEDEATYLERLKRSKELNSEETRSKEAYEYVKKVEEDEPLVTYFGAEKESSIAYLEKAVALDAYYHAAHYYLGLSYKGRKLYDKAMVELEKAIEIKPEYARGYAELGELYLKKGDNDKAIANYKRAITKDPDEPWYHYLLATAYKKEGSLNDAINEYKNALAIDLYCPTYQFGLAMTYLLKGMIRESIETLKEAEVPIYGVDDEEYEEAITLYQKTVKENPKNSLGYQGRGYIYYFKQEYKLAIENFERARGLNEKEFDSYFELGNSYLELGEREKAETYLKKAVQIDPNDFESHMSLGIIFTLKGNYDKAIEEYTTAVKINPESPRALKGLGSVLTWRAQYKEAIEVLKRAIEISPDDTFALISLGEAYSGNRMYEEAIAAYNKAIEIEPDNIQSHQGLASAYEDKGLYEEAIKEYEKANEIIKGNFYSRDIAEIYTEQGEYDKAIGIYKELLQDSPQDAYLHHSLAYTYAKAGKRLEAIEEYERTIALEPNDPEAHYSLGLSYRASNNDEDAQKAIEHLDKVLNITGGKSGREELRSKAIEVREACQKSLFLKRYPERLRTLSDEPGNTGSIAVLILAEMDYTKGNNLFIEGLKETQPEYEGLYSKMITGYVVSPKIYEAKGYFERFKDKVTKLKITGQEAGEIRDLCLDAARNRIEGIEISSQAFYIKAKDYRGEAEKGEGMIKMADNCILDGLRLLKKLMSNYPNTFGKFNHELLEGKIRYYETKYTH